MQFRPGDFSTKTGASARAPDVTSFPLPELKKFYFSDFENRRPPDFPGLPPAIERVWQFVAGITVGLGLWYLSWRWPHALNPEALWFAIPVAVAETASFLGTLLFFHDIWAPGDTKRQAPPHDRQHVGLSGSGPIRVDIMVTTFDEDPELVRHSLRDAGRVEEPDNIDVQLHVLDDGARDAMHDVAWQEGAIYHRRPDNRGFKAGNLRNALLQSGGDFVVICDADTRLFASFLRNTLGYFRDPDIAWVQTPHWFYDIPEGRDIGHGLARRLPARAGRWLFRNLRRLRLPRSGQDPFLSDPGLFFDVIQRRRNRNGASFCCGAASIHRREAVFEAALSRWKDQHSDLRVKFPMHARGKQSLLSATELTPFDYHVSEDILTSIRLHGDRRHRWRSVYHPDVEARMLSPWGMSAWAAQKLKYAGGTYDIALRHNPLFKPGMPWRTRLHYAATFWSYFSGFATFVLLIAPIITLLTGVAPVAAYSPAFFAHLLPLLIANELALTLGCWGHDPRRGALLPVASLGINFRAFGLALRGRKIGFKPTPKEPKIDPSLKMVALPASLIALSVLALIWGGVATFLGLGNHSAAMYAVNLFWIGWNISVLAVPVRAALWRPAPPLDDIGD